MAVHAAIARKPSPARQPLPVRTRKSARRSGRARAVLLALAAIGSALMAAAWMTGSNLPSLASAALPGNADRLTFEDRFVPAPASAALRSLERSVMAKVMAKADLKADIELSSAQDALALRWPQDLRSADLRSADLRPAIADDEARTVVSKPAGVDGIPLPRSRPVAADQPAQAQTGSALALAAESAPRPADRSLLQKFSDMMRTRMTLASLGPNGGGLFGKGPDLTALGYDNETAVYDITAHAIYLPNGTVLEAHSGMGSLRDDPDHVSVHNIGATPIAVYALKPREREFHGVAALRMIPTEGSDIGGRSGLLVHSYMLGPNGDSNGCVSVKEYERFLRAYNDGQFSHIAVVTSVKAIILAQQNAE
jgi:hypothetical protein